MDVLDDIKGGDVKTADERASEVCRALSLPEKGMAWVHITSALKEQDKITRHACAEAVDNCNEDASGECIWKNEAHAACINTQAI